MLNIEQLNTTEQLQEYIYSLNLDFKVDKTNNSVLENSSGYLDGLFPLIRIVTPNNKYPISLGLSKTIYSQVLLSLN